MNTKRKCLSRIRIYPAKETVVKMYHAQEKYIHSFYIFILTIDLVADRNTAAARKLMIITSILVNPFT